MNPDTLERRCPRLGGPVRFAYCKSCETDRSACFKIFDCWWERFDVVAHMQACLTPEAFEELRTRRPQPKVASLLDIVRRVQQEAVEGNEGND